jgi:hypothetical protein
MSAPSLARTAESGDRFYVFGDPPEQYWSVTTLIGGGVPKFLHNHYAKMTADLVLEDLKARPSGRSSVAIKRWAKLGRLWVQERQSRGELRSIKLAKLSELDLAARWIKGAAERHRDEKAELGSDVHDEAEAFILAHGEDLARAVSGDADLPAWPDRLAGHMTSFLAFCRDFEPEFLATEATVFNRTQAYAGTLDAILRVKLKNGSSGVLLVDYKSGRAVYEEVALQLSAYAHAEFVGLPDGVTEVPLPAIDAAAVLHITPDGYRFRLVRTDDAVFRAFQFAREVYRFRTELAGTVLLQDLTPAPREEVA